MNESTYSSTKVKKLIGCCSEEIKDKTRKMQQITNGSDNGGGEDTDKKKTCPGSEVGQSSATSESCRPPVENPNHPTNSYPSSLNFAVLDWSLCCDESF